MTLRDFINDLQRLKPSLMDKEIVIVAPNGLQFEPKVKMVYDNMADIFDAEKEPTQLVITFD